MYIILKHKQTNKDNGFSFSKCIYQVIYIYIYICHYHRTCLIFSNTYYTTIYICIVCIQQNNSFIINLN